MGIEAGIGWGKARLGTTLEALVAAFGQPSEEPSDDMNWAAWHALGLNVEVGSESGEVEQVVLHANDPSSPEFVPERPADPLLGQSEEAVRAALGVPRSVTAGPDGSWARLGYDGLIVGFAAGLAVNLSIVKRGLANPETLSNPQLEAAIAADPDQRAPWLVYGDWLLQQGHARGALVTAMASRSDAALEGRSEEELLGPALAPFADMLLERQWHLGFLRSVRLASNFDRSPVHDGELDAVPVSEVLGLLLDGLAGRFLRELTLGIIDFEENSYWDELGVLAARPRPMLERLFIGDFSRDETELNWSRLGNAGPMWGALPNLREVTLRSGSMELGELVLPELRSFTTLTGGLQKSNLESIARAQWPKLERLSLQIGSERYGSDVEFEDLEPVLKSLPPGLKHLGLTNTEHSDALVPLLAESEVLPRLQELDLSLGTLGAEGAASLVKFAPRFAHLTSLDLSESWLPPEWVARVREALPRAVLVEQHFDASSPDDRYIAAGE